MYRKAGISSIKSKSRSHLKFKEKSDELAENQFKVLTCQNQIKDNPQLRSQFQAICSNIGVDPLAYSQGCWSEILGLGVFYYHLGVKIIEVSSLKTPILLSNGKSMTENELKISVDDVKRSIKKLRCLGTGFSLINLPGGRSLVRSVPGEMSMDQTLVLSLAESSEVYFLSLFCFQNSNFHHTFLPKFI
ncbi:unnamed protein product [Trichobilharzia regenti]|nr:unnamed protein product [Trichobilharzia regenti]